MSRLSLTVQSLLCLGRVAGQHSDMQRIARDLGRFRLLRGLCWGRRAGIDFALTLVVELRARDVAERIALMIE